MVNLVLPRHLKSGELIGGTVSIAALYTMRPLLLPTEVVHTYLKEYSGQLYFFVRSAGVDTIGNAFTEFLKLLYRKPSRIS